MPSLTLKVRSCNHGLATFGLASFLSDTHHHSVEPVIELGSMAAIVIRVGDFDVAMVGALLNAGVSIVGPRLWCPSYKVP